MPAPVTSVAVDDPAATSHKVGGGAEPSARGASWWRKASQRPSGDQAGVESKPALGGPVTVLRVPALSSTSSCPSATMARLPWPTHGAESTPRDGPAGFVVVARGVPGLAGSVADAGGGATAKRVGAVVRLRAGGTRRPAVVSALATAAAVASTTSDVTAAHTANRPGIARGDAKPPRCPRRHRASATEPPSCSPPPICDDEPTVSYLLTPEAVRALHRTEGPPYREPWVKTPVALYGQPWRWRVAGCPMTVFSAERAIKKRSILGAQILQLGHEACQFTGAGYGELGEPTVGPGLVLAGPLDPWTPGPLDP